MYCLKVRYWNLDAEPQLHAIVNSRQASKVQKVADRSRLHVYDLLFAQDRLSKNIVQKPRLGYLLLRSMPGRTRLPLLHLQRDPETLNGIVRSKRLHKFAKFI